MIYHQSARDLKFNKSYFFKNPAIDPKQAILEYYKNDNPIITANLYYLNKDYSKAILSWATYFVKSFSEYTERLSDQEYYRETIHINQFGYPHYWYEEAFELSDITDDEIIQSIKDDYSKVYEHKDVFSEEQVVQIILAIIKRNTNEYYDIEQKIAEQIDKKFPVEKIDYLQQSSDAYDDLANKKQMELMSLLIDHLDSEALNGLKNEIDKRLRILNNENETGQLD